MAAKIIRYYRQGFLNFIRIFNCIRVYVQDAFYISSQLKEKHRNLCKAWMVADNEYDYSFASLYENSRDHAVSTLLTC